MLKRRQGLVLVDDNQPFIGGHNVEKYYNSCRQVDNELNFFNLCRVNCLRDCLRTHILPYSLRCYLYNQIYCNYRKTLSNISTSDLRLFHLPGTVQKI